MINTSNFKFCSLRLKAQMVHAKTTSFRDEFHIYDTVRKKITIIPYHTEHTIVIISYNFTDYAYYRLSAMNCVISWYALSASGQLLWNRKIPWMPISMFSC